MQKTAFFQTIALLLLLCLAAPLSSAYAEIQGVATVIALRGTVIAQGKGGATRNLSLKSQLFQEDVLKTDKHGRLQIMFTDNSIISLGGDSEMKIAEYRWQPEQKDGALITQALKGIFRVMGGALAKDAPQNFKTETPTATIGIRGSMYAFESTADSLSVVFQGGKGIEIFNDLGKVTITTPGFGTHVVLNAPPARPTKFTEQEINNLNRGLNGNGSGGSSGGGWGGMKSGADAPADPATITEQGLNGNGSGGSSGVGWGGTNSGTGAPVRPSTITEQGLNGNGSGSSSGVGWGGTNSGTGAPPLAGTNVAPKPPVSPVLPPVNMLPPSTPNLAPLPAPNTYRRNY